MTKEDDYRLNAAAAVELAHRAGTSRDKGRLLSMAEAWLDLADQAKQASKRRPGKDKDKEHPLIREKLDRHP